MVGACNSVFSFIFSRKLQKLDGVINKICRKVDQSKIIEEMAISDHSFEKYQQLLILTLTAVKIEIEFVKLYSCLYNFLESRKNLIGNALKMTKFVTDRQKILEIDFLYENTK